MDKAVQRMTELEGSVECSKTADRCPVGGVTTQLTLPSIERNARACVPWFRLASYS